MFTPFVLMAQRQTGTEVNNPRYDERRIITYGFSFGFHTSSLRLKYSDYFTTPAMDSVHSIVPLKRPGFSLGFIVNFKLAPFFDARITPKVTFSEYDLQYNYVGRGSSVETIESVGVDFPILFKYKSQRRDNIRMYIIGGITPSIEAAGKTELDEDQNLLQLERVNFMADFGFGFDLYYPLFKFSPEIRFSFGLVDIVGSNNDFTAGIKELKNKTVSIYFHFQ
ncbi:MAG: PorT family protein [Cyclobacteriaceae bacterium]|nr:PorT family protein [Cyclobacteriaceae bacterium]